MLLSVSVHLCTPSNFLELRFMKLSSVYVIILMSETRFHTHTEIRKKYILPYVLKFTDFFWILKK
jgi:hypothetical protein